MSQPSSWLETDLESGFGLDHLPLGVAEPGVVVRVGDFVLALEPLASRGLVRAVPGEVLARHSLGPLLSQGSTVLERLREELVELLTARPLDPVARSLQPVTEVELRLPISPRTYVDFYASEAHATNAGRIFRPDGPPLPPQWRLLPIAYHGRASSVVVSGTPVRRPWGLVRRDDVELSPSEKLDFEAEVGFVVARSSEPGTPVPARQFAEYVGGVVLANDWSARDIQALENFPLGPFASKSFATSIAAWVTPLVALRAARVEPPAQHPTPAPSLRDEDPWCLDLRLEVRLNGQVISRPPARTTYWSPGQMLAHLTDNGAPIEVEDLFCSGTVLGSADGEVGSLLEAAWGGTRPLRLANGEERSWLLDGDEVVITAEATGAFGGVLRLGEVAGAVQPAIAPAW